MSERHTGSAPRYGKRWMIHQACAAGPFPNPLNVGFGEGRILVAAFTDEDGRGVLLRDTGEEHPVGADAFLPAYKGVPPREGEIYLHFTDVQSAMVLRRILDEVIVGLSNDRAGTQEGRKPMQGEHMKMHRRHIDILGCRATDRITGLTGVVTSVSFDLDGRVQAILTPAVTDDGKVPSAPWIDAARLRVEASRVMAVPDFEVAMEAPAEKSSA